MSLVISAIIFILVVAIDQLTKYLVVSGMSLGQSIDVIPGIFRFTYIRNQGAAFGMLGSARWILMSLTIVTLIVIVYLLIRYRKKMGMLYNISFSLIVGGGFSNMIDRCFFGESFLNGTVIDFLDFCAFPKIWSYIFNVADACVVVGAFLFVIAYIRSEIIEERKRKKALENIENVEAPQNDTIDEDRNTQC